MPTLSVALQVIAALALAVSILPSALPAGALAKAGAAQQSAARRPIAIADLLAIERISEPQLSPDGTRAVSTVAIPDLSGNRLTRNVWIVTLANGQTRALTTTGRDSGAKWSPDGRRIAFVSSRSGSSQIYLMQQMRSAGHLATI